MDKSIEHSVDGQTIESNNQLSHQAEKETTETNHPTSDENNVGVTGTIQTQTNEKCNENDTNQSKNERNDNPDGKNCDILVERKDKDQTNTNAIKNPTEEILSTISTGDIDTKTEKKPFGSLNDKITPNGTIKTVQTNGDETKSNGQSPSSKSNGKKAVSLDKINEKVKKFISGEIIVDKENPFKKLNAKRRADFFSSTPTNLQQNSKVTFSIKEIPKDEYITKEDVLKESKYVKTYIKNPDEYFVYDPTIKQRLLREDQEEFATKNRNRISPPKKVNGTRNISKTTQERLRELKNRYSPSNLNYNQPKVRTIHSNGYANGCVASKLPTTQYRKVDRSKYPDLSQIKVKTGTDLEGTFFNPKEVALNAKKFDARIKSIAQFGSQDDLDEIADLTSDFDASGLDEIDTTPEEKPKEKIEESLTNTVNSREFQKYLAEKGLTLQPPLRIIETKPKMSTPTIESEVDAKKARKPSVLQRLFPNGFFSSRRRTTPKDSTPVPIKIHANEPKKEGRLSSARRLVLHRQSMPANCDAYLAKSNLKTSNALGGSSSSISSTLTNVENSEYLESYRANCNKSLKSKSNDSESARSLSGLRYIDSSSNSTIVTCDKNKNTDQHVQNIAKPIPRPRQHINGRSSVPLPQQTPITSKSNKEPSATLQKVRVLENRDRDSCVKTRVRTPKIPISNLRPLVNQRNDGKSDQIDEKRVNGFGSDTIKCEQPKRRNPSKLPERLNKVPACAQPNKRILCETSFEVQTNRNDVKTPDTFLNVSKAPKTSTPITDGAPPKFHAEMKKANNIQHEQTLNLSPISMQTDSVLEKPAQLKMDAVTWAKMQELKEKTDRQLYSQPLLIQAHMNAQPIAYSPRIIEQPQQPPIYDRLPVHNNMVAVQPLYAKVEKKSAVPISTQFIRNAPYRQSLDQIKLHAIQQQQLQQQHQQQQQQQQQTMNPAMVYQQPVFIRNSPQRNTISGIYRGSTMQRISPQIPQTPITIVQATQQQPQRPQSVLDEMMTGRRAQSTPSPSVQLRRNPLSRGEIMSQVIEFCRKSMSKTPTKLFGAASTEQVATVKDATSSEVSPISYSSMTPSKTSPSIASSRSGKIGPQVPIRKQSLLQQHQQQQQIKSNTNQIDQHHPIYERIPKHCTQIPVPLVNDENKPMNGMIGHYAVPPKRYIMVDNEHLTPTHVKQYQQINGSHASLNQPVYIQSIAQKNCNRIFNDANAYEYVNVCSDSNPSLSNNLLQIYHPNLTQKPTNQAMDRRFTPIILPTIPQHQQINGHASTVEVHLPPGYTKTKVVPKHGRIVMLNNVEQMYRPIAMPAKTIRYQTNQTSQTSLDSRQSRQSADTIDSLQSPKREIIAHKDWQNDKGKNQQSDQDDRRRGGRIRQTEDNRRHTLGNDMLVYAQQNQNLQQRAMDLEMGMRAQKNKKQQPPPVRGYAPVNQGPLFDDDPGIMSEVETASTGFRRGNKTRSSLPVVRTPSKTLERPLGLVFLQYRSETKRALLPNEITSIDTVRALFVRSFPRQLTMAYLEGPNVKIYIHDANKDMFYELEDVRSHLREIRDRSVLRLFESNEVNAPQALPAGPGTVPQPLPQTGTHWDQDQFGYCSEPEFDTEYSHQHVHKNKGVKGAPYYVGAAQTLPRGMYSDRNKNIIGPPVKPLRSYGSRGSMNAQYPYSQDQLYSIPDGYMSSPERGTRGSYEEPYYSQFGTRGSSVAPIIDEELSDVSLTENQYALYGHKSGRIPRNATQMYDPTRPEDLHRIRVEHMERQLANLTGLVQKALTQSVPPTANVNQNYLGVPGQYREDMDRHSSGSSPSIQVANGISDDIYVREKPPKLGKSSCHKSVSFEKSVSFSDDIQGLPKSHSPQHLSADSKPPKPAIKSSTLPRTSSQERDRLKPAPPPKPMFAGTVATTHVAYRPDLALAPEVYNHLRGLQKKAKDLRIEVRTLRRLSQAQAIAVREDIKDAFMGIRATLIANSGIFNGQNDHEKMRLTREEDLYKQEVMRLENDLGDLESSVEILRGEVINRRTRVNMAAVEDMALILSRASKTVAELKMRFPMLQNALRNVLSTEMEKVVREEKFLKDEPDRLESALRRCKKLTGTLVTLKRLASVQEQRLPGTCQEPGVDEIPRSVDHQPTNKPSTIQRMGSVPLSAGIAPENALDALLDELQTFSKPSVGMNESRPDDSTSTDDSSQNLAQPINNTVTTQISQATIYSTNELAPPNNNTSSLRRLHSYPSGSDTDTSPPQQKLRSVPGKPPVPERNAELMSKVINKRAPPPPPPRTSSSRSPLASPTSPSVAYNMPIVCENDQNNGNGDGGNSSGNESSNSQERQAALEYRHQELLKKQKQLQEQYARLQQINKSGPIPTNDPLKKTGSESNLPQKMGLNMAVSGSMKNLNVDVTIVEAEKNDRNQQQQAAQTTTKQVYETDIL
ncbi:uncharacterized protein LOC116348799 isoform X4 [Contarinia nasturtii]|uniref:uncharacterized protein LOC116348799 isoform X4 n=1 Tax=Contarinia nasturtii TaxID=265458 RepID=UPI0012D48271|nr:uncharacterized protein LOC116348799 isoform X4 [Contarinia nasturtii]